jgi:16S rRNA A1518/A1519 N6-dimethyltransferase RsmA/KsgA/DIM1 with predicted DNA glycosylase/AP lyase activity
LVEKGYDITAVEFNEDFCRELKRKFPNVRVLQEDVHNLNFNENERFDIVTGIELVQNLNKADLLDVLKTLGGGGGDQNATDQYL